MWKLINNLLDSKANELSPPEKLFDTVNFTYTCNHDTMATIVNNYFVSIGKKLASIIPPPNISAYPVVCSGPNSPACFVSLTAASLSNAFIIV